MMHLRIHHKIKYWGRSIGFKKSQGRGRNGTVWNTHRVYELDERWIYQRIKVVRVAHRACDGRFQRFDETTRPGRKLIDCPMCAGIADAYLLSDAKKPLTWGRRNTLLAKMKKGEIK